jgi:hypothetical protein
MTKSYEHTQVGYLIIAAVTAAIVLINVIQVTTGLNWVATAVSIILIAALILFASLTVVIGDNVLEIRFGPGLIRKRFYLPDIESCQMVKNPWYYGWGIHLTPHGSLYNVSGLHAVEIRLKTGRRFRIGTDRPQALYEAIAREIGFDSKN